MPEETVTITASRLAELEFAERKLGLLEAAGVDNWEWYGDAVAPLYDDEDDDDLD